MKALAESAFVSTGHLPSPERLQELVTEAHERYRTSAEGSNSNVYPALARVPSQLFGVATSLAPGSTAEAKWQLIHDGLSRFAGRTLALNGDVYASASETNHRNQSMARLLQSYGRIYSDPSEATDLYTRQCS